MNREKLLAKARNNPRGLRFDELIRLLDAYGWQLARVRGSHHIFKRDGVWDQINIQELKGGKAKPEQVKEVLRVIDTFGE